MRIFVTGASGWIGSAVVPELISAGHQVLGLARSDASAKAVADMGAEVLRGDLNDTDALRAGALDSDGVIHLAFVVPQRDRGRDTDRRHGHRDVCRHPRRLRETPADLRRDARHPRPTRDRTRRTRRRWAHRGTHRQHADRARGRTTAACAPAWSCCPARCTARENATASSPSSSPRPGPRGVSGYIGDGASRWPAVHVKDAARLYRLAVEQVPAGAVLNAVGDEGVPIREIAEAIGRQLNLPAQSLPAEEFGGMLARLLSTDMPASSTRTQELLGWKPIHPRLIEDIEQGHYFS